MEKKRLFRIHVYETEIDHFQLDMLLSVDGLSLIPVFKDTCHLEFMPSEDAISLEMLLLGRALSTTMFTALIEGIKKIRMTLDGYLLNESNLLISSHHIFFHQKSNQWLFTYIPLYHNRNDLTHLNDINLKRLLVDILYHPKARFIQYFNEIDLSRLLSDEQLSFDHLAEKINVKNQGQNQLTKPERDRGIGKIIRSFFKQSLPRRRLVIKNQHVSSKTLTLRMNAYLMDLNSQVKHPIYYDRVEIGRRIQSHICIDSSLVSSQHAVITKKFQGYYIQDQCSKNGTYVNQRRILDQTEIKNGAGICIGDKEFIFIC